MQPDLVALPWYSSMIFPMMNDSEFPSFQVLVLAVLELADDVEIGRISFMNENAIGRSGRQLFGQSVGRRWLIRPLFEETSGHGKAPHSHHPRR
jgi:hypothetical protein